MQKQKYDVTGMTCSACSAHVEKAVRKVQGVQNVTVNLLTNSMVVEADDSLSPQAVTAAVEKAGYGASPAGQGAAAQAQPAQKKSLRERAMMNAELQDAEEAAKDEAETKTDDTEAASEER